MYPTTLGAPAHEALRRATLAVSLLVAAPAAFAQTPPPAADGAPSEAARRAAASPYRFILQHAATPPARKAVPDKPEPQKEKEVAVRRPAPPPETPVQAAVRTAPTAPAAVPVPAPSPVEAQPTPPAPATPPVQTAARTQPVEPPRVRREVIPVRTDEPRLAAALLRERPNGVVRVQFEIQPDGSTGAVKVVSSTNRALNRATVDAVSGWKFQPVDEVLTVETEIAYRYD